MTGTLVTRELFLVITTSSTVMSSLHSTLTTCASAASKRRDFPLLSLASTHPNSDSKQDFSLSLPDFSTKQDFSHPFPVSGDSKQDFLLLSLAVGVPLSLSSTPFSLQMPCSRFGSCVLSLNAGVHCACIAGATLCRWDNIVGPRVIYVWTTSLEQRSWLAEKNLLGYIARSTLVGEVDRDPLRDEVKFFASADCDVALATIVFSCRGDEMADATVYSMSVIVPYAELMTFLRLKSICLEWLSRIVLQLRVLLSQVGDTFYYFF